MSNCSTCTNEPPCIPSHLLPPLPYYTGTMDLVHRCMTTSGHLAVTGDNDGVMKASGMC